MKREKDAAVRCAEELDGYLSRLSPGDHADLDTLEDIVRRHMRADLGDAMRDARRSGIEETARAAAEECDKVVEDPHTDMYVWSSDAAKKCASAIRARFGVEP